jgi:hypothetical protein
VHQVKRVRKPWTCEKCKAEIKVGDPAVKFAVGFRGRTRVRCSKSECFPKPSERESSLVAEVYSAQEEAGVDSAETLEDLYSVRDDVAQAAREVAGQYEESEMFEKNYDHQERADTLNSAADDLEAWEPIEDEPNEDDGQCTVDGEDYDDFQEAHAMWFDATRQSLSEAINDMELP